MGGNKSKQTRHMQINWTCQRNLHRSGTHDSYMDHILSSEECAVMNLEETDWKWPEGRVPYKIDIGLEEYPELITAIQQAIGQFHLQPPIRFVQLPPYSYEDSYVIFMFHETRISSDVGRQPQPQIVDINPRAQKGNVMHECMHVLGFYHEQSRPDREKFVEVSTKIPEEYKHNYEIEGHAIGSYDPDSIMHYFTDDFMRANPKLSARMRQREGFSSHDCMGLEYLYGEPQCSYDIFGEEYFIQANYECITCWGRDSAYSICEFCKNMHHKNCETIEHSFKDMNEKGIKSVCDCGRNRHRTKLCTRVTISDRNIAQNMYFCIDCFTSVQDSKSSWQYRKKGICKICIEKCHSGHTVESLGIFEGICACSEPIRRSHPCKALIQSL